MRSVLALLLSIGVVVVAVAGFVQQIMGTTLERNNEFVVERDETERAVAVRVANVFEVNPRVVFLVARATESAGTFKKGEYTIEQDMNVTQALALLRSGFQRPYSIKFTEGLTFPEWRKELAKKTKLEQTITGMTDDEVARAIGMEGAPEGWFFPDTYHFTAGETDLSILRRAWHRMEVELEELWNTRSAFVTSEEPYDALILASIIEKETGREPDRHKVSSVFHNRLREGMRLQSDPTVIYGMGDRYRGRLYYKHLRKDAPHNTYTRKGLPPTPICSPGRAAIEAAVHPEDTQYLYFVAKGRGRTHFSTTLAEHNKAVRQYRRR